MDVRKALHEKPMLTVLVCLIGAPLIFFLLRWSRETPTPHYSHPGLYYSCDDGKTYVAKPPALLPPFDEGGQEWVRARVFSTNGGPDFVAYLEKFTPEARTELEGIGMMVQRGQRMDELGDRVLLIKRPGAGEWFAKDSPSGMSITSTLGPDSKQKTPDDWQTGK